MEDNLKIEIKMEDDLKKNENERRPQKKWKTTRYFFWLKNKNDSIKKIEDDLKKMKKIEDDLNFFEKGRQSHFSENRRQTNYF